MPEVLGMPHREELGTALDHEFQQAWMPTPPILYRYVPEARAQNIRDGHLWASNLTVHARESDMLEFLLGWGIIRTTARAMADQAKTNLTLQTLCNRIADDRSPFDKDYSAYSVCLTTQPDAEHMWDMFAEDGGVRFGLRASELVSGIQRHQFALLEPTPDGPRRVGHHATLLAVHYDADELITAVEDMITKTVMPRVEARLAAKPMLDPVTAANIPFYSLRNVFIPMALSFKRAKFRPEREWRVVLTGFNGQATPPAPGLSLGWRDEAGNVSGLPIVDELLDPGRRAQAMVAQ